MSRGIPKASAQWTCAKAGGFDIIASAAKVRPVRGHGEWQESQQPLIIFENHQFEVLLSLDVVELQLTFPAFSRYRHWSTIQTQVLIQDLGVYEVDE